MPEQFLENFKKKMRSEWKIAFFAAFLIGLLTHLYIFTQYTPNHDGLINIYNSQLKFKSGRFFLGPFSGISSLFDLPWVIGLLSTLYLSLLAVVVTELLGLKKKISIWLTAGLIVTFPTITSTFSYMFTADGYMFGFLLAGLALLVTQKYKWGFLPGSIILFVSVGIYQANLPLTLTLAALVIIQSLLFGKDSIRHTLIKSSAYVAMVAIGMIFYAILFKAYQGIFGGEISDYQGLNDIGVASGGILSPFYSIAKSAVFYFFDGIVGRGEVSLFTVLNILLLVLIAVLFIAMGRRRSIGFTALAAAAIAAMPFLAYILYFVSSGVDYHMLMIMGLVPVYILPILFYEQMADSKVLAWSVVAVLGLTIFNFGLIANISYFNTTLKYEKSYANANRVLDRIEQTEGYEDANTLAIFGTHYLSSELGRTIIPQRIPEMTGVLGETSLAHPVHYQYMFANLFGVEFELATEEEREAILESEAFSDMAVWPHPDSVQIVDDVIILKLNE
ncbi:glucosyltransferase domain-containing protein [Planococcus sp. CAU13]|uniref:glucosyltransferase domain-containing protein n=1 Tax=Planococcus sp. CAU13 TaxID=1541197 RepID=UPI00052FF65F|nr:glucosyltransferase domain-containing protein [Planococcus sp. CAU13]